MNPWVFLWALMVASPALAVESSAEQADRLHSELIQHANQSDWPGVEARYQKLVKLRWSRVAANTHVLGGVAAHHAGDIESAIKRMSRAGREGREALKALRTGYGKVDIRAGSDRNLQSAAKMSEARARAIYDKAARSLVEKGEYRGWMPVGVYTLGGRSFAVSPRVTIRVR